MAPKKPFDPIWPIGPKLSGLMWNRPRFNVSIREQKFSSQKDIFGHFFKKNFKLANEDGYQTVPFGSLMTFETYLVCIWRSFLCDDGFIGISLILSHVLYNNDPGDNFWWQMVLSTFTYLTMVLNDDALISWNSCSMAANQSFSHSKMNFSNIFNHDYSRMKMMILNKIVFWSNGDSATRGYDFLAIEEVVTWRHMYAVAIFVRWIYPMRIVLMDKNADLKSLGSHEFKLIRIRNFDPSKLFQLEEVGGPKLRRHAHGVTWLPPLWTKNHTPVYIIKHSQRQHKKINKGSTSLTKFICR